MSKVSIQGDASGTGTLTIAAPNTNSNYTLTLPTNTGTVVVKDGSNDVTLNDITAGGIYLGGTGAANYLDDYEEGTFTLLGERVSWSEEGSTTGKYVKVGRYVHCSVSTTVTNMVYDGTGSGWAFYGLPFTVADAAIVNFSECTCFTSGLVSLCNIGDFLFARSSRYTSGGIGSGTFNSGAQKLKFTLTYYTNS